MSLQKRRSVPGIAPLAQRSLAPKLGEFEFLGLELY
jgi:hypothetical protein